jgi:hypothetical protein
MVGLDVMAPAKKGHTAQWSVKDVKTVAGLLNNCFGFPLYRVLSHLHNLGVRFSR